MAITKQNKLDQLSASMTYNYVKSVVWYHFRGKIKELESIILNDDLNDQESIKRKIKNMLKHRTSVYIREFNTLDAPVKKVGRHYTDYFEFTPFLNDVYDVVFSNDDVHIKLSLITDIMEAHQTEANNQLLECLAISKFLIRSFLKVGIANLSRISIYPSFKWMLRVLSICWVVGNSHFG